MLKNILFVFVLVWSVQIAGQGEDVTSDLTRQLDELLTNKKAVTELAGLQVVLIKDGKRQFEFAGGMAHQSEDNQITPLTIDHKVRVASISKFVMALGFMTLVEEGKVDLDEDVSKYLGFNLRNPNYPKAKITASQLLSHTSSIRDAGVYFLEHGQSFKDFFFPSKYYKDGAHFASGSSGKNEAPGEFFTYSNLNFGILAGIIEMVTGERFDVFMDKTVFKPLGLNISFNGCQFSNKGHQYIATLYRRGMWGETWDPDGPWKAQVDDTERTCYYGGPKVSSDKVHMLRELDGYEAGSNPTLFSPQGGLRASAKDLSDLIMLLVSEKDLSAGESKAVLSHKTIKQMLTPVWQHQSDKDNGHTGGEADIDDISSMGLKRAYGLSTHIINLKDWRMSEEDSVWYGHMAAAYGLLGQLWFNPDTNDGIVILLTGMGDNPYKPERTTPMAEIEAQVLRIALDGLSRL